MIPEVDVQHIRFRVPCSGCNVLGLVLSLLTFVAIRTLPVVDNLTALGESVRGDVESQVTDSSRVARTLWGRSKGLIFCCL